MKARYTLPIDIVFLHILPKLPVKSLLRFKCVSKSFNTEISSPEFVKAQHLHALSSDDNLLLFIPSYTDSAFKTRIGCFDIKAERWANDVPLPDMLLSEDGPKLTRQLNFRIGSLDEKLCIMSGDVKCSTYDLWVMKEYGVKESWVKLMSLPTPNGVEEHYKFRHIMYRPFAYRKGSRHEVLCRRGTGEYFWYNVKNKEVVEAEFKIPLFNDICCSSDVCKGSLLNIPRSQQLPLPSESEPITEEGDKEEEDNFANLY